MSSESPKTASQQIPSEIWAEIFTGLPREALLPITLAQWSFHPLPEADHIDRYLQRLQFWSSAEIAPLVRTCRVTQWPPGLKYAWHWQYGTTMDNPFILLEALFDSFPYFTNLRHLLFNDIHFTQIGMENLCLLPKLTTLEVYYCTVAEEAVVSTLVPLHLSEFRLAQHVHRNSVDHWVPWVCAGTLRHLHIPYNERLFTRLEDHPSFPSVRLLKIDLNHETTSRDLVLISKFTGVEVLIIHGSLHFGDSWEPPHLRLRDWTSLKKYTGPHQLLHLLLPIPSLRHVVIHLYDEPRVLLAELDAITSNHVASLDAEFRIFDNGIFEKLHIKISLRMWLDAFWEADEFFETLIEHSPLSIDIQKLAIHWEYVGGPAMGFGPPDLNEVKEALISKHPAMKMLWIDGSEVMYLWRKGHAAIQYAYDGKPEEAKERREDLRLLWKTI
ncbi:hypothetical protein C8R44DRAFT_896735 [Mycena epipterygia]|nr:hypothetical protein C8R44DRAFT_896735 [Mycena epipterygia]